MNIFKIIFFIAMFLFCSFQASPEQRKLYQVRITLPFGPSKSDSEAYYFTDWAEPTAQADAIIEELFETITKETRLYFMDLPSEKSKNFTSQNISLLLEPSKEPASYLRARRDLWQLAKSKPGASVEEIAEIIPAASKTLCLSDDISKAGLRVFSSTVSNMKIAKPGTLLLFNLKTRASKKIENLSELSAQDLLKKIKEFGL